MAQGAQRTGAPAGMSVATAEPPAPAVAGASSGAGRSRARHPMRATLLMLLAFCLLGAGPLALTGEFLGLWRLPFATGFGASPQARAAEPDLALPRHVWAAARVTVLDRPESGARVAVLEPGFPVLLTGHRQAASGLWSRIQWTGPTKTSGGQGWAPDAAFVAVGGESRSLVGDLGALAPSLERGAAAQGDHLAAAIYFPGAGALYRAQPDRALALGDGFRAPVLAALLAQGEAASPPRAVPLATLLALAGGNDGVASAAYEQIGGAGGLTQYLAGTGATGIQAAAGAWSGGQATVSGLLAFYDALAEGRTLNAADRTLALAALARGGVSQPVGAAATQALGQGTVVLAGVSQGAGGWTETLVGVAMPAAGTHIVVVLAALDEPTRAAADQALAEICAQLAPVTAP